MNAQPRLKMPSNPSSRPDHHAAIPLLYAALAALHAGGSPQEIAAGIIYLILALKHLNITARPSK